MSYRITVLSVALAALVVAGLVAAPAHAKTHHATPEGIDTTLPQSLMPAEAEVRRGQQRINLVTGAPVALYRVDYPVTAAQPEIMARQYLQEVAATLKLDDASTADLALHAVRDIGPVTTVRLRQHVGGIPVLGAEVTVSLNAKPEVIYVLNGYRPGLDAESLSPSQNSALSATKAFELALEALPLEGDIAHQSQRLAILAEGTGRLVWEVRIEPSVSPPGDWQIILDATTGELLRLINKATFGGGGTLVQGAADVFDPDPLSSAGVTYNTPGYTDGNDADTPQLTAELFRVTLPQITEDGGMYSLVSPWAEIVDFESPFRGLFTQNSPTFAFTRNEDGFEAAHAFFHIDQIMRYLNETLDLGIQPYQYSGGVRFDPHGLNGADNSFYQSGSGRMAFGEGGVDDAEDADVVIHELGHGLHDWVTSGGLSQVNGLSEGIGDFVASSYSRSLNQWTSADPQYFWVFDWDGHNSFWGGRVTNHPAVYPAGLIGQIHTDGQIWATCMMRIWDDIGRDLTETAHWTGIGMTNGSANQEDAAQAVVDASVALGFAHHDVIAIETILRSCGYDITAPVTSVFEDGFETGTTVNWMVGPPV